MTASCKCKHLNIILFFSRSCLALRILIFLFFLFIDTVEFSCLETCIFLPVLKAGKVNYSNKALLTRESLGSALIFISLKVGKSDTVLSSQITWNCNMCSLAISKRMGNCLRYFVEGILFCCVFCFIPQVATTLQCRMQDYYISKCSSCW